LIFLKDYLKRKNEASLQVRPSGIAPHVFCTFYVDNFVRK